MFKRVGGSIEVQLMYRTSQIFFTLLRLDLAIAIFLVMLASFFLFNSVFGAEAVLNIIAVVLTAIWSRIGRYLVRHEYGQTLKVWAGFACIEPIYIIYKFVCMNFAAVYTDSPRTTYLQFYLVGSGALVIRALLLRYAYACYCNFGKGLTDVFRDDNEPKSSTMDGRDSKTAIAIGGISGGLNAGLLGAAGTGYIKLGNHNNKGGYLHNDNMTASYVRYAPPAPTMNTSAPQYVASATPSSSSSKTTPSTTATVSTSSAPSSSSSSTSSSSASSTSQGKSGKAVSKGNKKRKGGEGAVAINSDVSSSPHVTSSTGASGYDTNSDDSMGTIRNDHQSAQRASSNNRDITNNNTNNQNDNVEYASSGPLKSTTRQTNRVSVVQSGKAMYEKADEDPYARMLMSESVLSSDSSLSDLSSIGRQSGSVPQVVDDGRRRKGSTDPSGTPSSRRRSRSRSRSRTRELRAEREALSKPVWE